MRALAVALLLLCSAASHAATQPFVRGSLQQIVQAHRGHAFILGVWSLSCSPCRDELAMLGKLVRKHPALRLVLVSTDAPGDRAEIASVLKSNRLATAESWVYAESNSERLRYEIDRDWYGELPRSYFFDAQGRAQGMSGKLDMNEIERWVREHE